MWLASDRSRSVRRLRVPPQCLLAHLSLANLVLPSHPTRTTFGGNHNNDQLVLSRRYAIVPTTPHSIAEATLPAVACRLASLASLVYSGGFPQ